MITNHDRMPAVLDLPTLIGAVTLPEAVTAVEEAFRALAHHTVLQPAATWLGLPGGEVHVKSAQLGPHQRVVVKVATGFAGNPGRGGYHRAMAPWSSFTRIPDRLLAVLFLGNTVDCRSATPSGSRRARSELRAPAPTSTSRMVNFGRRIQNRALAREETPPHPALRTSPDGGATSKRQTSENSGGLCDALAVKPISAITQKACM